MAEKISMVMARPAISAWPMSCCWCWTRRKNRRRLLDAPTIAGYADEEGRCSDPLRVDKRDAAGNKGRANYRRDSRQTEVMRHSPRPCIAFRPGPVRACRAYFGWSTAPTRRLQARVHGDLLKLRFAFNLDFDRANMKYLLHDSGSVRPPTFVCSPTRPRICTFRAERSVVDRYASGSGLKERRSASRPKQGSDTWSKAQRRSRSH